MDMTLLKWTLRQPFSLPYVACSLFPGSLHRGVEVLPSISLLGRKNSMQAYT